MREQGAWVQAMEVLSDRAHMLFEVDPKFGVHGLDKALKRCFSRMLHQGLAHLRRRLPKLSNNAYFVATTGGAPLVAIRRFAESQRHL